MKNEALRKEIEKCTTPKQVLKVLDKYNIEIVRDSTDEVDCFSVWIDETTRIYQHFGHMVWQTWHKVDFSYSGTPTYLDGEDDEYDGYYKKYRNKRSNWRPGDAPWDAPGMKPSDFVR